VVPAKGRTWVCLVHCTQNTRPGALHGNAEHVQDAAPKDCYKRDFRSRAHVRMSAFGCGKDVVSRLYEALARLCLEYNS
jgi:hypothetical protein